MLQFSVEHVLDVRFLNDRCPPKCNCDERFWYDAIDSMEGPVEDYELAVMEWWMPGQPHLTSHPKKDTLICIATHAYWQCQQDSIGGHHPNAPSLILDCPLPPCFHWLYKNIDAICDDWKILEHDMLLKSCLNKSCLNKSSNLLLLDFVP